MEFQAHLLEYEQLYQGMFNQMDGARQIVVNALLIAAAAVPVLSLLVQQRIYVSLLLTPMVFAGAAWLFQWHLHSIFVTSAYIRQVLAPKVIAVAGFSGSESAFRKGVWGFNLFSSRMKGLNKLIVQGLSSFLTLNAVLLPILPSALCLGVFIVVRGTAAWEWWELALFVLNIVLSATAIGFSAISPYLAKLYYE
jgi:hypothetical protein